MISEPVWLAREDERKRYGRRLLLFSVALVTGAVATGTALAAFGTWLWPAASGTALTAALVAIGVLVLARELFLRKAPIPQLKWQVPRGWMRRFWAGAVAFGATMGAGLFTLQPSALFHVYVLGCLASTDVRRGAVMGATYGLTYVAVFLYATMRWRPGTAGYSTGYHWDKMQALAGRLRPVGALAAPLVALVPSGLGGA